MAPLSLARLAQLSLALVAMMPSASQARPCFELTAAFRYDDGYTYLISNYSYLQVDDHFNEVGRGKVREKFQIPEPVGAAMFDSRPQDLYFFHGDQYRVLSRYGGGDAHLSPSYDAKFLGGFYEHGVDAIAAVTVRQPRRLRVRVVFKGCQYLKQVNFEYPPQTGAIGDLGLTDVCDVDAAWSQDGHFYVVKGDDVWLTDLDLKNVVRLPNGLVGPSTRNPVKLCTPRPTRSQTG